ncbi:hypothetical protein [Kitasatospora sp. NPDC088134]|uniref:hypothetical protein n=1 Tax=Kitasatospora sp. NPDC088134 TaxID=3364071 RepID=UPI0037F9BBC4
MDETIPNPAAETSTVEVAVPPAPAGARPAACWRRAVASVDREQQGGFAVRGERLPAGGHAVLAVGTLVITVDRCALGPALPRGRGQRPQVDEDADVAVLLATANGLMELWRRHYQSARSACGPTTLRTLEKLLAEHPPPPGPPAEVICPNSAAGECRWCGQQVRAGAGRQAPAVGGAKAEGAVEHWPSCPPRGARDGEVCTDCGRSVVRGDAHQVLIRDGDDPGSAEWRTRHLPYLRCTVNPQRTWEELQAANAAIAENTALLVEQGRARAAAEQRRQEAEAETVREEDRVVAAAVGPVAAEHPPVRAVGKLLRDGRRFALYLVPATDDPYDYRALALIAGTIATVPFRPAVAPSDEVPGLPYLLKVPLDPAPRARPALVGLTAAEEKTLGRAGVAWRRRFAAALRAAAPGARTWTIPDLPIRPAVGEVLWDSAERTHVRVLAHRRRWLEEDGLSFGLVPEQESHYSRAGLAPESGWLYIATVRAALPGEMPGAGCRCADPSTPCPNPS